MSLAASEFRAVLHRHSRSFTLASRLLPQGMRDEAAVVYAWCRRADDAIDCAGDEAPVDALRRLRRELEAIGRGDAAEEPVLVAFAEVVRARRIPLQYPEDLLSGLHMDVQGLEYQSLEQLLGYCYRVASTVGLMMCHIMGVHQPAALRRAAHLGLAMQLTNICRDVAEDWQLGRLYLPADLLRRHGVCALRARGGPFPAAAADGCRGVLRELLGLADRYYASSEAGLAFLAPRCALSVDVARRVYSAIGRRIALQEYDVLAGRAVVPARAKLFACAAAVAASAVRPSGGLGLPRALATAPVPSLPPVSYGPELLHL
jgi:15-cis-phytoene synthase